MFSFTCIIHFVNELMNRLGIKKMDLSSFSRSTSNQKIAGSSPASPCKNKKRVCGFELLLERRKIEEKGWKGAPFILETVREIVGKSR